MRLFMQHRQTDTVAVAAAKASFSPATGHRLARDPCLPSMKKGVRGRRRPDPLGDLFQTEVVPLLQAAAGLRPMAQEAATIFRVRDLLVGQRTRIINTLRGHLAEYGLI